MPVGLERRDPDRLAARIDLDVVDAPVGDSLRSHRPRPWKSLRCSRDERAENVVQEIAALIMLDSVPPMQDSRIAIACTCASIWARIEGCPFCVLR